MTLGLLSVIKTLAFWIGAFCLAQSLWKCFKSWRSATALAFSGSILIGLSCLLPGLTPIKSGLVGIPVALPLMPSEFLLTAVFGALSLSPIVAMVSALTKAERTKALLWAGLWITLALVWAWVGMHSTTKFRIKTGVIDLNASSALLLAALAVSGTLSMSYVMHKAQASQRAKAFATHIGLAIGSIIFGLPLVWMLDSSFRTDGQMASEHGIAWIPTIRDEVIYSDPAKPYYSTALHGHHLEGVPLRTLANGMIQLEIRRPFSLIGQTAEVLQSNLTEIPQAEPVVFIRTPNGQRMGLDLETLQDNRHRVHILNQPGPDLIVDAAKLTPSTHPGIRWQNYAESLEFLPSEAAYGLVYLQNTLIIVGLSVVGAVFSSAIVAYGFARLKFIGNKFLFGVLVSTMMLPSAVTLMPQFMIFRELGWVDTLTPLWIPAFFAGAFNVFMLRQFFAGVPIELDEAAKLDGCSVPKTFWSVTLPQIKPALVTIAIWTAVASWNNFTGPLIYISSPRNMPISYAVQLFQSSRSDDPALLMAFVTISVIPIVLLFLFAQRYFLQSAATSGLGGR